MTLGPQRTAEQGDPFAPNSEYQPAEGEASVVAQANGAGLAPQVIERLNAVPWMAEEDAAFSIGMQILEADSLEEIFAELESRSVTKMGLVGPALILRSFALAPSAFAGEAGKCPVVAYVDAVKEDGSPVQFPIGNWGPTMQLVRSYEKGSLHAESLETAIKVKIIAIPSKTAGHAPALRFVLL